MNNSEKPSWLKVRLDLEAIDSVRSLLAELNVITICEHALCPNIGECYAERTVTFLILGEICTRACRFCSVKKGIPRQPDITEPKRIAQAVRKLGIRYAVITSVTRDDLEDFGATHFASTVREIKHSNPGVVVETLIPDFKGSNQALEKLIRAGPDVIAHNLETVPRLYPIVRPGASYWRSLELLRAVKHLCPNIITKSGLMLGLGEREQEVIEVLRDLRSVGCDVVVIGQYLRPTKYQIEVKEYLSPEKFEEYKRIGEQLSLKMISMPLARSSYRAASVFEDLRRRN